MGLGTLTYHMQFNLSVLSSGDSWKHVTLSPFHRWGNRGSVMPAFLLVKAGTWTESVTPIQGSFRGTALLLLARKDPRGPFCWLAEVERSISGSSVSWLDSSGLRQAQPSLPIFAFIFSVAVKDRNVEH